MKPKMKLKPIIIGLILVFPFWLWVFGAFGADQNIYLDNAGAGAGSEGDPYGAFAEINWTTGGANSIFDWVAGGDDVYINLKKGVTWRETLTSGASGVAGHPITMQAYGSGASPIISGADIMCTWEQHSITNNYGDTAAPGNAGSILDDYVYYVEVAVTYGGTLTALKYHVQDGNGTAAKMALYTNNGGVPGSLVSGSDSAEVTLTDGVSQVFTFTPSGNPLLSATTYFIAYWGESQNITASVPAVGAPVIWYGYEALVYDGNFPANASHDSGGTTKDGNHDKYIVVDSNIWKKIDVATEPHNVFFDGVEGTEEISGVTYVDSLNEWCWSGNTIFVFSTSDADTAFTSPGIEGSQRDSVLVVDGKSYITIDGLTFQMTNSTTKGAVELDDTQYLILQNCTVQYGTTYNINLFKSAGTSANNTITGNTIKYTTYAGTWSANIRLLDTNTNTISENTLEDAGGTANCGQIILSGDTTDSNTIEKNDLIGPSEDGISLDLADLNTIRYNFIQDCSAVGLETKQGANSNKFLYNICIDNHVAIQGDGSAGVNDANLYYGNTIYWESGTGSGYGFTLHTNNTNCVFKNNAIYLNTANAVTVLNITGTFTGFVSDYNVMIDDSSGGFINYDGDWYTVATFATYQAAKSQDANSIASDPLLIDASSGDFNLKEDSPCNNAGTDLGATYDDALRPESSWPSDVVTEDQDEWGSGWEIGAYIRMAPPSQVMGGQL